MEGGETRCRQVAVGFPLKSGVTCIAHDNGRHVVFAVQSGAYEPYITWRYDFDQDRLEYVFWAGHYFRDIVNAAKDFKERT